MKEMKKLLNKTTIWVIFYKDSCFDSFSSPNPRLSIKNKEDPTLEEKKKKQNTKEPPFTINERGSDSSATQSAREHPSATATE